MRRRYRQFILRVFNLENRMTNLENDIKIIYLNNKFVYKLNS